MIDFDKLNYLNEKTQSLKPGEEFRVSQGFILDVFYQEKPGTGRHVPHWLEQFVEWAHLNYCEVEFTDSKSLCITIRKRIV